ncbi:heavy metal-associated isoprenylated plant protein 36 [Jatropha curcas]|nr:heavy metal-associated isoprenylated plant protein 36 [Jatropha curcas]
MSTTFGGEEPPKALKCRTWVLKVSIHCQGCKRKVKKVLQAIDGVYTATVDSQQQTVTVTGNIGAEILIKKLIKTGKHAEIWPEKLSSKENETAKAKETKNGQDYTNNGRKQSVKFSGERKSEETKNVIKSPESPTDVEELPEVKNKDRESEGGGARNAGKKKKKKAQKSENNNTVSSSGSPPSGSAAGNGYPNQGEGIDQVVGPANLNPTRQQQWVPFPPGFNIPLPPVYASSYSMVNPRGSPGPFYYVPPYLHNTTTHQLDSFYYFSDENVNGCSIM